MANYDRPFPTVVQDGRGSSVGTATSLIMGDKGPVFTISFHPRKLWRDTYFAESHTSTQVKVTNKQPNSFFVTCFCQHLENLQKKKCSMLELIIVISTSHVRNNKSHVTSHEMSCWVELLIG